MGLGVIELLVLMMVGVAIVRFLQQRQNVTAEEAARISRRRWKFAAAAGGGLAFIALILGTVGFSRTVAVRPAETVQIAIRREEKLRNTELASLRALESKNRQQQTADRANRNAGAVSALAVENELLPQADRTVVEAAAPGWLTDVPAELNGVKTLVISSQQFATEDEARQDAERQILEIVKNDLASYPPKPFSLRVPALNPVGSGQVIRQEYLQTMQRDFGSFFAPMYRQWYQIELSPVTRETYLRASLDGRSEARLMTVGAGVLALLLIPVGVLIAGTLTRISSSGENSRLLWMGIVGGLVVGMWYVIAQVLNWYVVLW